VLLAQRGDGLGLRPFTVDPLPPIRELLRVGLPDPLPVRREPGEVEPTEVFVGGKVGEDDLHQALEVLGEVILVVEERHLREVLGALPVGGLPLLAELLRVALLRSVLPVRDPFQLEGELLVPGTDDEPLLQDGPRVGVGLVATREARELQDLVPDPGARRGLLLLEALRRVGGERGAAEGDEDQDGSQTEAHPSSSRSCD
jgi:hypothetical protein